MADLILREDLGRTDLSSVDSGEVIPPATPGEVLRLEFMEPAGLSAHALAKATGVPTNRVAAILHGTAASRPTRRCAWRGISAPTPKCG